MKLIIYEDVITALSKSGTKTEPALYLPGEFITLNIYPVLSKIINNLQNGFLKSTASHPLDEHPESLYVSAEEIEHFKEDLTVVLLSRELSNLCFLQAEEKEQLAKYALGLSYEEVRISRASVSSGSSFRSAVIDGREIIRTKLDGDNFSGWYDSIHPVIFEKIWKNKAYQNSIKFLRRFPGSNHEWLMCSKTLKLKQLGIPSLLLNSLVTPTVDCRFVLTSDGAVMHHGGKGSTTMHNILGDIIETAASANELYCELHTFISEILVDDVQSKPFLLETLKSVMT